MRIDSRDCFFVRMGIFFQQLFFRVWHTFVEKMSSPLPDVAEAWWDLKKDRYDVFFGRKKARHKAAVDARNEKAHLEDLFEVNPIEKRIALAMTQSAAYADAVGAERAKARCERFLTGGSLETPREAVGTFSKGRASMAGRAMLSGSMRASVSAGVVGGVALQKSAGGYQAGTMGGSRKTIVRLSQVGGIDASMLMKTIGPAGPTEEPPPLREKKIVEHSTTTSAGETVTVTCESDLEEIYWFVYYSVRPEAEWDWLMGEFAGSAPSTSAAPGEKPSPGGKNLPESPMELAMTLAAERKPPPAFAKTAVSFQPFHDSEETPSKIPTRAKSAQERRNQRLLDRFRLQNSLFEKIWELTARYPFFLYSDILSLATKEDRFLAFLLQTASEEWSPELAAAAEADPFCGLFKGLSVASSEHDESEGASSSSSAALRKPPTRLQLRGDAVSPGSETAEENHLLSPGRRATPVKKRAYTYSSSEDNASARSGSTGGDLSLQDSADSIISEEIMDIRVLPELEVRLAAAVYHADPDLAYEVLSSMARSRDVLFRLARAFSMARFAIEVLCPRTFDEAAWSLETVFWNNKAIKSSQEKFDTILLCRRLYPQLLETLEEGVGGGEQMLSGGRGRGENKARSSEESSSELLEKQGSKSEEEGSKSESSGTPADAVKSGSGSSGSGDSAKSAKSSGGPSSEKSNTNEKSKSNSSDEDPALPCSEPQQSSSISFDTASSSTPSSSSASRSNDLLYPLSPSSLDHSIFLKNRVFLDRGGDPSAKPQTHAAKTPNSTTWASLTRAEYGLEASSSRSAASRRDSASSVATTNYSSTPSFVSSYHLPHATHQAIGFGRLIKLLISEGFPNEAMRLWRGRPRHLLGLDGRAALLVLSGCLESAELVRDIAV